ncbi:RidA family protein [Veillonella sp. R32]|uniref:RidA family protein n=1 Tax=Veillonella sp. R32 TaxID=2021312 RepID=UPI001389F80B|nr:RidA family protein [Veillonella sp. R32]KAF1678956.1 regulator [Veillonella sp. R32]
MEIITSNLAPKALGPYSQAIKVNGLLFISGQGGLQPESGTLVDGVEAQTLQAIKNIEAILKEAGLDFTNVVKTTCFLADMADFATFNGVYQEYFVSKPARSCVAVKELPANFLVEIEVIAEV